MRRCLIIDDSKIIRMVSRKIIQELGFDVDESGDGQHAIEHCQETMPDVILLDWKLPEIDGIDVLKALRALPGGEQPAVLFCTTETDDAHIKDAIDTGATDYVIKPFDGETIHRKFASIGLL